MEKDENTCLECEKYEYKEFDKLCEKCFHEWKDTISDNYSYSENDYDYQENKIEKIDFSKIEFSKFKFDFKNKNNNCELKSIPDVCHTLENISNDELKLKDYINNMIKYYYIFDVNKLINQEKDPPKIFEDTINNTNNDNRYNKCLLCDEITIFDNIYCIIHKYRNKNVNKYF